MKKLIITILVITLNSCTTNEDINKPYPYKERFYYKTPTSTNWIARDVYRDLNPAYINAPCGLVVESGMQNNDGAIWRYEWRVECK